MRSTLATRAGAALAVGAIALVTGFAPARAADQATEVCRFSDERLTEISGMTTSLRHPGVLWVHNDSSGGPRVYAIDAATCSTLATVTIDGIDARDIEAIAAGRDDKGRAVLWIADIGDNLDSWDEVRIHRVREPGVLRDRTVTARTYRFTYSDRPHNAETLLADPDSGQLWVVTRQLARGTLYALPVPLSPTGVNVARPVRREGGLVTDGAVSPDGSRYVLRDYVDALVFAGLPPGTQEQRVYLPFQMQGEAITWTPDGRALLTAGEKDDRLLRIEVPAETATPDGSLGPSSGASATVGPSAGSDAASGRESSVLGSGSGGRATVALALALVLAAGLVIAIAEWARRRARGG